MAGVPPTQGGLYLDTDMELGPRTFDHEQLYDCRCWMVQDCEAIVQNHLFRAPAGHAFLSFLLKVYLVNVFEEAHVVQVRFSQSGNGANHPWILSHCQTEDICSHGGLTTLCSWGFFPLWVRAGNWSVRGHGLAAAVRQQWSVAAA